MCGIGGGFSVSSAEMLDLLEHRGEDGRGAYTRGELCLVHLLHATFSREAQPLASDSLALVSNGEVYNHRALKEEHALSFSTGSDCEAILRMVEEHYRGDLLSAVAKALPELDGEFAFAVTDGRAIALARDLLGTKPLYFSRRAFASEKKALWGSGEEAACLSPGQVLCLSPEGVRRRRVERFRRRSLASPEEELASALVEAVRKRAGHVKRFGVLFSGGVDSALVARICADLGYEPRLYAVAMPGSLDARRLRIERFSELEVVLREVAPDELEAAIDPVLYAIEEPSPLKLAIALPVFLAAEEAKAAGEKVLLTGQGSDELFAGYARYEALGSALDEALRQDVEKLHCTNLERDDKAAMAAQVELLHPYLDRRVVEVALSTPAELKIRGGTRKHILRSV
ncbi:MAG: asparagine synthetase B, partial [Euryarchaeota archaeon]|nr:asparagine synthetase B [Euryarchaeota archaeon]